MIRRWSRGAADKEKGGIGAFDATLSVDRAGGLFTMHFLRRIAHCALRFSARAAILAIDRNDFSLLA